MKKPFASYISLSLSELMLQDFNSITSSRVDPQLNTYPKKNLSQNVVRKGTMTEQACLQIEILYRQMGPKASKRVYVRIKTAKTDCTDAAEVFSIAHLPEKTTDENNEIGSMCIFYEFVEA